MTYLRLYVAILLLFVSFGIHAADQTSPRYINPAKSFDNYIEKFRENDVFITLPEKFSPLDVRGNADVRYTIGCGTPIGSIDWYYATTDIETIIEDDSCRVAICFPKTPKDGVRSILGGKGIEADLRMTNNDMYLDVRPMIKIIAQDDMSQYANADTVVMYEFEMFNRPFMATYCMGTGIYLKKNAHPSILLRLMFNLNSVKDKEKYIRIALDNIHFGDSPTDRYIEYEKQAGKVSDLAFPTKYRELTGILPDVNDETLAELNRIRAWREAHGMKELPQISDEVLDALNHSKNYVTVKRHQADSILEAPVPERKKILSARILDKEPSFPGGDTAMREWLRQHMQYPAKAEQKDKTVTVIVDFVVGSDGSIRDAKVVGQSNDSVFDREAIRLIMSMPKWHPATYKGKSVNAYYSRPVEFRPEKTVTNSNASERSSVLAWNHEPYKMSSVPQIPKYPGGTDAMYSWIADNIIYPAEAVKAKIEGKVIVEFIISETGSVENPKIVKGVTPSLDKEALRIIGAMPRWEPGRAHGNPVKTSFTVPVTFRLAKDR